MKIGDLVTLRSGNGLTKAGTMGIIVKQGLWADAPIWTVHWFGDIQKFQKTLVMGKNLKVVKSVSSA